MSHKKPDKDAICRHCGILTNFEQLLSPTVCKECNRKRARERYVPLPPEDWKPLRSPNRSKVKWHKTIVGYETIRSTRLERTYGISLDEYKELHESQSGLCAICKQPERRVVRGVKSCLAVDHDHNTNQVRGLLCFACNSSLGKFGDSIELLKSAIKYLEKHNR